MFRNRIFNALAIIRSAIVFSIGLLVIANKSWANDYYFFINLDFLEEWKEWMLMVGFIIALIGVCLFFYSLYKALKESILNGIEEGQRLINSSKHASLTLIMQQIIIYLLLLVTGFVFCMVYFFWTSNNRTIIYGGRYVNLEDVFKEELKETIAVMFFCAGLILLISIFFYVIQKMVTKQVLKVEEKNRLSIELDED